MTTMKVFASALLATTMLAAPATAQSNPPAQNQKPMATQPNKQPSAAQRDVQKPMAADSNQNKPMAASPSAAQTNQQAGQWRTSQLVGLDVYNAQNEDIGEINELIMGNDGQIDLVVIGVGGFLGMGEHDVALKWDQVKFVNEPVKSSTTTSRPTGATTGTGAAAPVNAANANRDHPDHAVVNMTKDQLKALPQFKYASDTASR